MKTEISHYLKSTTKSLYRKQQVINRASDPQLKGNGKDSPEFTPHINTELVVHDVVNITLLGKNML